MSWCNWAIALADGQKSVLSSVLRDADTTKDAAEYLFRPMRINAAISVESEDTWHLPTAAEFASVRKRSGIEVSRMLGEAQGIGAVGTGANPPFRSNSQDADEHFHNYALTPFRLCFSTFSICVSAMFSRSRKL